MNSPFHLKEEVSVVSSLKTCTASNALQPFHVTVLACVIFLGFYIPILKTLQWLLCAIFLPSCLFSARSPARRRSRKRIHLKYVCQPQPKREKNHLLPLHLCHRYRQHSICFPRGEGPHLAGQPGSLQPGLRECCCCCNSIGFVQLAVRSALQWFSLPHTAAEHYNPKQDIETLQSLSAKWLYYWCISNFPVRLFENGCLQL